MLMELMLQISDNSATDILLDYAGCVGISHLREPPVCVGLIFGHVCWQRWRGRDCPPPFARDRRHHCLPIVPGPHLGLARRHERDAARCEFPHFLASISPQFHINFHPLCLNFPEVRTHCHSCSPEMPTTWEEANVGAGKWEVRYRPDSHHKRAESINRHTQGTRAIKTAQGNIRQRSPFCCLVLCLIFGGTCNNLCLAELVWERAG